MDTDYYKDNIIKMLSENTYAKTGTSSDKKTMSTIRNMLVSTTAELTVKERDYLVKFDVKSSQFYGLPKIHKSEVIKTAIKQQNSICVKITNPSDLKFRPIVAGPACPTHRTSDILDKLLRPFIKHVRSYVRDDLDFLNHLPNQLEPDEYLITLDITSLYSNIDHNIGREAITYWLDKYPAELHPRFTKDFILKCMDIVLTNNYFQFNGEEYKQTFGTAMGTKFAPTYATLVLGYLEAKVYDTIKSKYGENVQKHFTEKWRRYLDDCFLIWKNDLCQLQDLIYILNNMNNNIKFTMETSQVSLPFLDILVNVENKHIITDIYYKPTDTKQYLDYRSCHPRATRNNVPYNLARRICTIVKNIPLRDIRLRELEISLIDRNYPIGVIKRGIDMASSINIEILRNPQCKEEGNIIPFVNTHNPSRPNIFKHIREALPVLNSSPRMKDALEDTKFINSKRQPPNLKHILVNARFIEHQGNTGSRQCGDKKCKCCNDISTVSMFNFHASGHKFYIKDDLNCNSQNLLYVLICHGCEEYYIGQTGCDLRSRCRVHRQGISNNSSIPVDRHIFNCAKGLKKPYSIVPFYKLKTSVKDKRLVQESYFIDKFKPKLNHKP
jgi:hypothetical protein